ncbi:MAG: molybdopterin-dependent oxidoreductase [Thermosphaera aggregans]|jgi:DMSO/TMAO reductase YedYZ molybdopterin-dependent catalytic subunit|uniref:molybdopterin-dependent oxidoreductase n=1 Tax=Thermosphaera aggregans TaxID=54254 RepID=UPI003C0121FD
MKCYLVEEESTRVKGVKYVVDCVVDEKLLRSVEELQSMINEVFHASFEMEKPIELVFDSNEPIGSNHLLYRFRIMLDNGRYIGVRIVTRNNKVKRVLFTVPEGYDGLNFNINLVKDQPVLRENAEFNDGGHPPGQVFIPNFVIYNILGIPKFSIEEWRLEITGLVENPVTLDLKGLYDLGLADYSIDFHCVTGWSVRSVAMRGVPFERVLNLIKPIHGVKWVYTEGMDGYTTIFPFEEVLKPNAFLALEMNGRPLEFLHGYPVRLIVPHLYGWKSAKWLRRIVFMDKYVNGYWESFGYHPRGRVYEEERFKDY